MGVELDKNFFDTSKNFLIPIYNHCIIEEKTQLTA